MTPPPLDKKDPKIIKLASEYANMAASIDYDQLVNMRKQLEAFKADFNAAEKTRIGALNLIFQTITVEFSCDVGKEVSLYEQKEK